MKTPRLNHKLVLEDPQKVDDGAGGFTDNWQALGTLWAQMTPLTGREMARAEMPISAMRYKIVVRGAPYGAPNRPKPEQRFRSGERLFAIEAVADHDPNGRYLVCFAKQETAL